MIRTSLRAKTGSVGSGAAPSSAANQSATRGGRSIRQAATIARASARVVPSGTVGPDATCAGLSPGTSDTTSDSTRAGHAAAASRPPLMPLTCFLIAFITEIGAPEASSARFSAASSSSVRSPGGQGSKAEPPPQISATTRSSGPKPLTAANSASVAASPAASGTGCAASITRIWRVAQP